MQQGRLHEFDTGQDEAPLVLTTPGHDIDGRSSSRIDHASGRAIAGKGGADRKPPVDTQLSGFGVTVPDTRPGRGGTGKYRSYAEALLEARGNPGPGLGARHVRDANVVGHQRRLQQSAQASPIVMERFALCHESPSRTEGPFDPAIADIHQQLHTNKLN